MTDRLHTIAMMAATLAAKDIDADGPVKPVAYEMYAHRACDLLEAVEREVTTREAEAAEDMAPDLERQLNERL